MSARVRDADARVRIASVASVAPVAVLGDEAGVDRHVVGHPNEALAGFRSARQFDRVGRPVLVQVGVQRGLVPGVTDGRAEPFGDGDVDSVGPWPQSVEPVVAVLVGGPTLVDRRSSVVLAGDRDGDARETRFVVVLQAVAVAVGPHPVTDRSGDHPHGRGVGLHGQGEVRRAETEPVPVPIAVAGAVRREGDPVGHGRTARHRAASEDPQGRDLRPAVRAAGRPELRLRAPPGRPVRLVARVRSVECHVLRGTVGVADRFTGVRIDGHRLRELDASVERRAVRVTTVRQDVDQVEVPQIGVVSVRGTEVPLDGVAGNHDRRRCGLLDADAPGRHHAQPTLRRAPALLGPVRGRRDDHGVGDRPGGRTLLDHGRVGDGCDPHSGRHVVQRPCQSLPGRSVLGRDGVDHGRE